MTHSNLFELHSVTNRTLKNTLPGKITNAIANIKSLKNSILTNLIIFCFVLRKKEKNILFGKTWKD